MTADRRIIRLIAEATALEDIAVLSAHLAAVDPRFAAVGRLAEDRQFERLSALRATGFDLPQPEERTAEINGRLYQLPSGVTASVVRELFTPAAPPSGNRNEENMTTHVEKLEKKDPNATLNGPEQPPAAEGVFAFVTRHCTLRNGVIAGAVVLLGAAVYCAVTRGADVPTTA